MEPSEVIAARELVFVAPDGSETISAVQLGRPYPNEGLSCYCCDFEIPGIEKRR